MEQFLRVLAQSFISAFTSESAKALAKHLFGEKQKPTLTPEKRNKGRNNKLYQ